MLEKFGQLATATTLGMSIAGLGITGVGAVQQQINEHAFEISEISAEEPSNNLHHQFLYHADNTLDAHPVPEDFQEWLRVARLLALPAILLNTFKATQYAQTVKQQTRSSRDGHDVKTGASLYEAASLISTAGFLVGLTGTSAVLQGAGIGCYIAALAGKNFAGTRMDDVQKMLEEKDLYVLMQDKNASIPALLLNTMKKHPFIAVSTAATLLATTTHQTNQLNITQVKEKLVGLVTAGSYATNSSAMLLHKLLHQKGHQNGKLALLNGLGAGRAATAWEPGYPHDQGLALLESFSLIAANMIGSTIGTQQQNEEVLLLKRTQQTQPSPKEPDATIVALATLSSLAFTWTNLDHVQYPSSSSAFQEKIGLSSNVSAFTPVCTDDDKAIYSISASPQEPCIDIMLSASALPTLQSRLEEFLEKFPVEILPYLDNTWAYYDPFEGNAYTEQYSKKMIAEIQSSATFENKDFSAKQVDIIRNHPHVTQSIIDVLDQDKDPKEALRALSSSVDEAYRIMLRNIDHESIETPSTQSDSIAARTLQLSMLEAFYTAYEERNTTGEMLQNLARLLAFTTIASTAVAGASLSTLKGAGTITDYMQRAHSR